MLEYYINLILVFSLLLGSRYIRKNNLIFSNLLILYAFIINFINSGLRFGVGTDFFSYYDHYVNAFSLDIYNTEPIYSIGVKLLKYISVNKPQLIFMVSSLIILYFIYKSALQQCEYYELSIFLFITLYFYYSSLNIVRQWIAISIVLYGYKYLINRNLKKYILITIVAGLIHNTAFFMLIIGPLLIIKFNSKKNKLIIFILFSFGILFNGLNKLIFILIKISPKYEKYLRYDDINQSAGRAYILITFLLLIWIIIRKNQLKKELGDLDLYINTTIYILIFSILGNRNMIFGRIQMYILPIIIFLIPNLVKTYKGKLKNIIYYSILILGIIYMSRSLIINGGGVVPYKSAILLF